MKRQRGVSDMIWADRGDDSNRGNDLYDNIRQQNKDGQSVQNSWFTVRSQVLNNGIDDQTKIPEIAVSTAIRSFSQQLIQVKRRLWPAAEKCAVAWDSTPAKEFRSARAFANPMEALGECRHGGLNQMFINRSAIKLANIDAILDFRLTIPRVTDDREPAHFLFADLCGAPGGFSEYIMKRIRSRRTGCVCRGYGISLAGENEHGKGVAWRLEDFSESDSNFSINYRIFYGSSGTGDIYDWENVKRFREEIQRDLQEALISQQKLNLVVADGGFDAQRDSECQEGLAQKLVLCELAAALELIDYGGTLVLKLFGCKSESIRMAMRSMCDVFGSIELIKPVSSRPASSERYAIFTSFKGFPNNWEGGQSWINSILTGNCLKEDIAFYFRIDAYLDRFDRDMLLLNLKACFAIMSRLERRIIVKESNINTTEMVLQEEREQINVSGYKHDWQLFI